ncbi:MAG: translation elongation factor 4, partial [Peptostreptococcaceae bacterium]|nr:translation elongation factor 4 [Peptostreptococcaceae bacterium]
MTKQERTRNFSIIAHIDHGKSTLADRLIQETGLVSQREMKEQLLDNLDLERERGITIKLQSIRLVYKADDGNEYYLNLIDTPGHVDFNYEVSRSLAACEGALLVVDAAQGVEAQTLANVYLAVDQELEIVPVINKIDLPSARPEEIKEEIEEIVGIDASYAPLVSAKNGINIKDVLEAIVKYVPAPKGDIDGKLKALIFDSFYDSYKGVIVYTRIVQGSVKKGDKIKMMATNKEFEVTEVGVMAPNPMKLDILQAGDVGYIAASIKDIRSCRVGDTITNAMNPITDVLPGYKRANPMVYCGVYPAEGEKYENIREALEKMQINDAALEFEPETSAALGFGFRCGFLGLLHLEIIQERLEREFDLNLITTAPSVLYKVNRLDGETVMIQNPSDLPPTTEIQTIEEPIVTADIIVPSDFVGKVMELAQERRGVMT